MLYFHDELAQNTIEFYPLISMQACTFSFKNK